MAGPQIKKKKETRETPMTGKETAAERHRKKVEDAFELVDKLDQEEHLEQLEKEKNIPKQAARKPESRSGLRVRFGIDALISDRDRQTADDKEIRTGESTLLDFGITLPYIWKIPVIGKRVLKLIKHMQKEDRPESVRDILRSLRRK